MGKRQGLMTATISVPEQVNSHSDTRIAVLRTEQVPTDGLSTLPASELGYKDNYSKYYSPQVGQRQSGEDNIAEAETIPIVMPARRAEPQDNFILLNKWEGYVISSGPEECRAVIKDLTNPNLADEEILFSLDEIQEEDLNLVKPGAVFYLYIGYYINATGTRMTSHIFKFRRLPQWSKSELRRIEMDTREIADQLGWK